MAVGNRSQNGYSENDLLRMQQDAMRRVRSMQEQAQRTLEGQFLTPGARPSLPPPMPRPANLEAFPAPARELPPSASPLSPPARSGNILTNLLSSINLDNGQLLILGIMALLFFEGADPALLIALGYIML